MGVLPGLVVVTVAAVSLLGSGSLQGAYHCPSVVAEPSSVVVRVVTEGNKPVEGASALIVSRTRRSEAVLTSAEGFARVPWSPGANETAWVVATVPDFVRGCVAAPIPGEAGTAPDAVVVEVAHGVFLSGTVRDAVTGAGLPDARVEAGEDQQGEVDCTMPPLPIFGEGSTDGDGSFRVGPVPPDCRLLLRCEAASHAPRVLTRGSRSMTLAPGVLLSGVVRDSSGRPVEGAEVTASIEPDGTGDGTVSPRPVRTDRDGHYSVDGLARGRTYDIVAEKEGSGRALLDRGIEIGAKTPPTVSVSLVLLRPVTVTIHVVGSDGRPVEDADVHVDAPGSLHMGSTREGRGEVSFNVQPGTLTVKVASPRFAPGTLKSEAVEGEPLDLTVSLKPAPR